MVIDFFQGLRTRTLFFILFFLSHATLGQRYEILPEVRYTTPGAGTYTVPSPPGLGAGEYVDEIVLSIIMTGGGGGGGRGQGAGGGGGGQVLTFTVDASLGNTYAYTVGAGGAGATVDGASGGSGNPTLFDTQTANPGIGGEGGNAGRGMQSGIGRPGGAGASAGGNRRAGGGGGGALGDGTDGTVSTSGTPRASGGNGGAGLLGFGGGGGGTGTSNRFQTQGSGRDGGTNGSVGNAMNATNGAGGGGGRSSGGNGGDGLLIISATFIILPAEYAYINAIFDRKTRVGTVTWATFREWENSHFELERSVNAVSVFEPIAQVNGVGYSHRLTDYTYEDMHLPLFGSMAYYRVKQVDFSGAFTYSKTVGIRISQAEVSQGVWRAYPNPTAGDQLKISLLDFVQYAGEPITFQLIHPELITEAIQFSSETEMNEHLASLLPKIPREMLVLKIQWGQKVEYLKVLKK